MSHIFTLEFNFMLNGIEDITIYPTILQDEKELILVDCGYPFFLSKIEEEMKRINLSMNDLTKIIITHHDHDHMGSLKEIQDKYPSIEILSSAEQVPYITGKKESLRLLQAKAMHKTLPEDQKEGSQKFQDFIASIETVDKVTPLSYSDVLPWCGGIEIVDTKGHMPGHISLYLPKEKTLIAGDALVVQNGHLFLAHPEYTLNVEDAVRSVENLLNYDIEKIICYHGGEYSRDVKNSLRRIVESKK
ncbi:MAG: MBL fold metallo-hydrolase [Sebaldella sp.]|nr:MBL fold metallo-hydrolase [Sebaldella sp.]